LPFAAAALFLALVAALVFAVRVMVPRFAVAFALTSIVAMPFAFLIRVIRLHVAVAVMLSASAIFTHVISPFVR